MNYETFVVLSYSILFIVVYLVMITFTLELLHKVLDIPYDDINASALFWPITLPFFVMLLVSTLPFTVYDYIKQRIQS
jgi:flagellar biosynthesis protein FlhB